MGAHVSDRPVSHLVRAVHTSDSAGSHEARVQMSHLAFKRGHVHQVLSISQQLRGSSV